METWQFTWKFDNLSQEVYMGEKGKMIWGRAGYVKQHNGFPE